VVLNRSQGTKGDVAGAEHAGAVCFDDRDAYRAVGEPPETLKLEAIGRRHCGEEREVSPDRLLAGIDELPRRVEQHDTPPLTYEGEPTVWTIS
jgi:hypothetical protein